MDKIDYSYALITPAYNEEKYIHDTIKSVVRQTLLPVKWIIVSDGSTDHTDMIVEEFARKNKFIEYIRLDKTVDSKDFASKVLAFNHGFGLISGLSFSVIGNLDADVTFDCDYFERILREFHKNPKLGIASGQIFEEYNGQLKKLAFDDIRYVSGRVQLFRRNCYDEIGGYLPVETGGEDTIAVVMARMHGWECTTFPYLKIHHHKKSTSARGCLNESFRDGAKDYALGSHPLYQIAKSIHRIKQKPYFMVALVRMAGFCWQYARKRERPVTDSFIKYFRGEQAVKMKSFIHRKPDVA